MAQVSRSLSVGMVFPFRKLKTSQPVLAKVGMCILMLPRSRVAQPLILPVDRSIRIRTFCAWASKARPKSAIGPTKASIMPSEYLDVIADLASSSHILLSTSMCMDLHGEPVQLLFCGLQTIDKSSIALV